MSKLEYNQFQAYIDGLYADGIMSEKDYNDVILYILANGETEKTPRDLIQIRRGLEENLPNLAQGEMGFTLDTKELYIGGLNENIKITTTPIYVNAKEFGVKGDGVTDDTIALQKVIDEKKNVYLPQGTYIVSDTIILEEDGSSLVGLPENVRDYGQTANIKYVGPLNKRKAVIQVGKNGVGEEPTRNTGNVILKNLHITANNLVGFCVYGTYLNQESLIDNIVVRDSLEYNLYIARAWYLTITNILSNHCFNNGIALGMPLEYLDGTKVDWVTPSPLELNQVKIDNIRAHGSGRIYKDENPGTYTPTNLSMRRKGYGIGAGVGNGFSMTNFVSERNGGTSLYVLNGGQPRKVIQYGYIESSAENSGLNPATENPSIIIENLSAAGQGTVLRDIFIAYSDGGIYHTGEKKEVWLENIYEPRFLKSLEGLDSYELYSFILKRNVYYGCGFYNTALSEAASTLAVKTVNTRYTFDVELVPQDKSFNMIFIRKEGTEPLGSATIVFDDDTTTNISFTDLIDGEFVLKTVVRGNIKKITKAGGTGEFDSNVTFKIVNTKETY